MAVHPYLFFSGTCAEAFARYQEVLGGELDVMTHADLPPDAEPMPGAEPHHVMHAALKLPDALIMGSDDPTGTDGPKVGVAVVFESADVETSRRIFEQLSEGGEVQMPFEPTFYSPGFGACLDRWGIPWMIDTSMPADA